MGSDGVRSAVRTRVYALGVVIIAFAALITVAALQGQPEFGDTFLAGADREITGVQQTPQPESTMPPLDPREPNPWIAIIAAVLGSAVALLIAFLLVRFIVRVVRQWWRDRPLRLADGVVPTAGLVAVAEQEESIEATVVRHGIAGALDAVSAHPDPSDAITAAWVGLEDAAERAGQRRGVSETPAEFTLRIVGMRTQSAPHVRALLGLYENVRFGGRSAGEMERERARALLTSIEEHWR